MRLSQSPAARKDQRSILLRHPKILLAVYVGLLIASNIVQWPGQVPRSAFERSGRDVIQVPVQTAESSSNSETVDLAYLAFGPEDTQRPPVILLHGSPGSASDLIPLSTELAHLDRRAYALDMPGFGMSSHWVPDYSARAYARYVLAFIDAMEIDSAHVVGWSNGGAVALNLADITADSLQPRLESITLLAAIASQRTEGSGSYAFEHLKYAVGYAGLVILPEFIPHFGFPLPRAFRHAFIRNFWDTDQRPLDRIMESLDVPTLILHGRHDPLVSDWAAEQHHDLIATSTLVMTEHSHFLPFMQPALTAGILEEHFIRHDLPGTPPRTDTRIDAPKVGQAWFRSMLEAVREWSWPFAIAVFAMLALLRREPATAIAGLFVGHGVLDFGVAFAGLFIGRLAQPRCPCAPRTPIRTVIARLLWTGVSLLIAQLALSSATGIAEQGVASVLLAVLSMSLLLNFLKLLPTRARRRHLSVKVRRLFHHEWWPSWMLYMLILPHFLRLAIRHRSLTVWTCVNPGIHPGGGIIGESKVEILDGLDPTDSLPQQTIEPNSDKPGRLEIAKRMIESDPTTHNAGLAYPVVVKPEAGERGDRVSIVHSHADLKRALAVISEPAIVQKYHPGPVELGVFWVRDVKTIGSEQTDEPQGSIFAVTKKVFPILECDGERTIREQILAHKRFRMQAGVYCSNLKADLGEIPPKGTHIRLTDIGNHVKGCRFEDGNDLITPELSAAIDRIARTWRGASGEPFDYGRFDLRSSSEEAVRSGEDLAIIELNGVTSEATNLYDPSWSPVRAIRLLSRQWTIACALGSARRDIGQKPMTLVEILRTLLA